MIKHSNFSLQSVAEKHETCIKHDLAASGIFTSQPGLLKKNKPKNQDSHFPVLLQTNTAE